MPQMNVESASAYAPVTAPLKADTPPTTSLCVGIDLGTTNSCVGYYDLDRGVVICANEFGRRTTPSYVAFNENERMVGEPAVRQQARNAKYTLYESKRFIGHTYQECDHEHIHYPFEIIDIGDNNVNFLVNYHGEDRIFCPEEIAAIILNKMAVVAAQTAGVPVGAAVITVPAYFNDAQRQATRDAGKLAGLEVLRIINEPTAAAIAYGLDHKTADNQRDTNVLVFDIGGGTIDTSLLTVTVDGIFEVLAIAGDTHLGGADFDQLLVQYVANRYRQQFPSHTLDQNNPKIRQACERAKCELSGVQSVEIELVGMAPGKEDFFCTVTRPQFNDICAELFDRCLELVQKTLTDAQLSKESVDEVVLVGGSTRIPKLQEMLSEFFGGKELCKSINPDEAVAYGAAIQAAVLSAEETGAEGVPDIVLLDVCPLSLGVETTGGLMSVIIPRNTMVPVKKSKIYSTIEDNQSEVTVQVFEGERSCTADNRLLGSFELSGIQAAPRGAPKIRVRFELDADGIFTVTARDESELRLEVEAVVEHTLTIQNNKGRLSDNEVEKLLKDAEAMEAQDAIFRQTVRDRTDLENLLFGVRRTFSESEQLKQHADQADIKCVLDIVEEQFNWLNSDQGGQAAPSEALVQDLQRRREWLENEVARPMVDAVNIAIRDEAINK